MSGCNCGEWSGVACEWSGPDDDLVLVEFMPEQHRTSHEAAGNHGVYPVNGSILIRVSQECAKQMIKHDGDWCSEVAS